MIRLLAVFLVVSSFAACDREKPERSSKNDNEAKVKVDEKGVEVGDDVKVDHDSVEVGNDVKVDKNGVKVGGIEVKVPTGGPGDVDSSGTIACPNGGCVHTCKDGETCKANCSGGRCTFRCGKNGNCDFNCSGGSCIEQCAEGADCDFACSGGRCKQDCGSGAKACDRSCTGSGCS